MKFIFKVILMLNIVFSGFSSAYEGGAGEKAISDLDSPIGKDELQLDQENDVTEASKYTEKENTHIGSMAEKNDIKLDVVSDSEQQSKQKKGGNVEVESIKVKDDSQLGPRSVSEEESMQIEDSNEDNIITKNSLQLQRYLAHQTLRTQIEQDISLYELKLKQIRLKKELEKERFVPKPVVKNVTKVGANSKPVAPMNVSKPLPTLNVLSHYTKNEKQLYIVEINGRRLKVPLTKYSPFYVNNDRYELFSQGNSIYIRRFK
ncbi:hypothetical protein GCM10007916_28840 [Psychromonas marina]|uniref:Uncharacterized protein n=1 Tax=Psychromonas marina TaxID=88364 RepID=A0ABQ6E321_9GAMM|nr:hypothetical protein [Psychromonas marina]GLS91814.1 hypothetical protein GCM10007916_28840 [Psychromonas marina]